MVFDHHASDSGHGRYLDTARGVLSTVVSPLRHAVDLPVSAISRINANLVSHASLVAENERLRHRLFLNRTKLRRLADLEAENNRLRELLGASERVREQVLVAGLLSVAMDPFSRRATLDKGTRDGVTPGYSLVDTEGIMGQVIAVGPFSSTALLITDPSHALPVRMKRDGLLSIALGTGIQDLLELSHVPDDTEIRVGDELITSGLGGVFPPGYPVGSVARIERGEGRLFARVLIKPKSRMERNREVLLVKPVARAPAVDVPAGSIGKAETAASGTLGQ